MLEFCIVLVEPKYSGNIGSVARCMKNFGVSELYLVNPCELDDTAYMMAVHAGDILDRAKIFSRFEDAIRDLDLAVATTSVIEEHRKACLRKAYTPKELLEIIKGFNGKVGIVFGREDYGLYNEEIKECDLLLTIPTSKEYPSMNLSHAVAVVLYELFSCRFDRRIKDRNIGVVEKEKFMEVFDKVLELIDYPDHKKEKARITFRRALGRARLTELEYHTLMGIVNGIIEKLRSK